MTRRPRAGASSKVPRRPAKTPRRARAAVVAAVALALAVTASVGVYVFPGPPAKSGRSTTVLLGPGLGVFGIASALGRAGVVRSPWLFIAAAEATGAAKSLMAGEYDFTSRASVASVLGAVRGGEVVRHFVTIPEGLSSRQVTEALASADELSGGAPTPPEGSLLPETYQVARGESRIHVARRMQRARDTALAHLWAGRSSGLPYRSPEEAVILASIVEKETARAAERPHIAAVFLNRLAKGMRLESDPTVVYGLTRGEPLGHGLRVSELARASAYNTYLENGLPPTPIANPGRAALEAALHPATSTDLYFVADGTGGHVFSDTLAAHQKNVARWRSLEQTRARAPGATAR